MAAGDRKLYVYSKELGRVVEKHEAESARMASLGVLPDIEPFISYATDTPTLIGSRSTLRAYEKANGLRQVGTDMDGYVKPPAPVMAPKIAKELRERLAEQGYFTR